VTGGAGAVRLEIRARLVRAIRRFFETQGFIEVDTPVWLPAPALELHIDAIPADGAYLRTSPELQMKRLLAEGWDRIYQMGPCFRRGESGRLHNPEFTMLEWYRRDADYRAIQADTEALIRAVVAEVGGSLRLTGTRGAQLDVGGPWHVITVDEAYRRFAGWSPLADYDADRFDLDLVNCVEPNLPRDRPVILTDFPIEAAALARCRGANPPVAERWELYIDGLELANAYSELIDPGEQRRRFQACADDRRALGREVYPLDEEFLAALAALDCPCGGIALGVDRLAMLLAGVREIELVRPFCRSNSHYGCGQPKG
jgi:elongation factor P--(R)-beta-lysine ligase